MRILPKGQVIAGQSGHQRSAREVDQVSSQRSTTKSDQRNLENDFLLTWFHKHQEIDTCRKEAVQFIGDLTVAEGIDEAQKEFKCLW